MKFPLNFQLIKFISSPQDSQGKDLELAAGLHYSDKNEPSDSAKSANVSKVVGASRNVNDQLYTQISPSTDELNLKIASAKNVWESMPSMPSVLEINNEESSQLDLGKYDEAKMRSSFVFTNAMNSNAMNSNAMNSNAMNTNAMNSNAMNSNAMKPIQSNEELKKSHQQLYQQHAAANQMHQQISQQQQHPVLISAACGSPPNLMSHMNSLDSVRRVQNQQYQLQRISSPSNLIYNTAPTQQMVPNATPANVNIYQQFASQMKSMHQTNAMMAPHQQFAANPFALNQSQPPMGLNPNLNMNISQNMGMAGQNPLSMQPQMANNLPPGAKQPNMVQIPQQPPYNAFTKQQPNMVQIPSQPPYNAFVQPPSLHPAGPNPMGNAPPNAFYAPPPQSQPPPPNLNPNAQKPAAYYAPATHQMQAQQHLAQQIQAAGGPPPPPQQQFNYIQSQQFNLMNQQNSQLANAQQNYRNQKRFI